MNDLHRHFMSVVCKIQIIFWLLLVDIVIMQKSTFICNFQGGYSYML